MECIMIFWLMYRCFRYGFFDIYKLCGYGKPVLNLKTINYGR